MNILVPLIVIVAIAIVGVFILGFSASLVGYGLLKTTAKFGSAAKSSSTTSGAVAPFGWSITNSRNMPTQMTQASDGSYFFDFPSMDGVHYVVEPAPRLQLGQLVTLTFNISGSGSVVPVQGTPPAKVSLFMQRKGDNLTGSGPYQQYRYWHTSADLVAGDGTLSCTLTPDQWGDVFGKRGTDFQSQFEACVANAEMIGFTFGDPGAGATGHGAYAVNGPARFTLKSFAIQ